VRVGRLWSAFLHHDGRIAHKWEHYFPAYERHLERFVDRPVTVWEIGVAAGGSLQLWKDWFGPRAVIVGLDVDPACRQVEEEQVSVRIGSQADTAFLAEVLAEFGAPDVVIDDGSHVMSDLRATFDWLYPRTADDGVYIVEDLHTAYWSEYGGGLRRQGSFIEYAKDLMDELNQAHTRGAVSPTPFSRSTLSMHVYDSMIVFERGRVRPPRALRRGSMS
jgi:hypothetical protein